MIKQLVLEARSGVRKGKDLKAACGTAVFWERKARKDKARFVLGMTLLWITP